jgi:hypothetical protein
MIHKISVFLLLCNCLFAQQKFTLSGIIKDKKTGETMIGMAIYPVEDNKKGTTCNSYGFYSLTLPEGKYHIVCSMLGYVNDTMKVTLNQNITQDRIVTDEAVAIKEVVIKSEKSNENITSTRIGVEKLDIKEIAKIPVIFGEKDILKTIQLLPGVKSAGEGNSGFCWVK